MNLEKPLDAGFYNYVQQKQKKYVNQYLYDHRRAPSKLEFINNIYSLMANVPKSIMLACWNRCKAEALHVKTDTIEASNELDQIPELTDLFEDLAVESEDTSVLDIIRKYLDQSDDDESNESDCAEVDDLGAADDGNEISNTTPTTFKQATITNYFSQQIFLTDFECFSRFSV